jgi:GNAT superfamily N-acetyltransferase
LHQTYLVSDQAQADIPQDAPYVSMTEETFRRWFSAPGHHPDRIWIACQGDDVLGVSLLVYPPVRGHVRTQWTGTARAARGRGVARALKLETLLQAIEFGVPLVRTDNDHRNAPILHLNQDFGYQAVPGLIRFQKPA